MKIQRKERQIIYEMWTGGSTQKQIAAHLDIAESTLRSELWKGFNGERYMGGRRVYDPELAERYSGISGRTAYRQQQLTQSFPLNTMKENDKQGSDKN